MRWSPRRKRSKTRTPLDDDALREATGAIVATGIGGILTFWISSEKAKRDGTWSKVTPFFIPMLMANAASAHISMAFGLRGPVFAVSSALRERQRRARGGVSTMIASGDAPVWLPGGSEATISPLAVGGFCSMKAMSTRNDDPQRASRPFDKDRDGFVLGEGAGVLVLEEYEHAKARGARIYCEMLGYGQSADAYHIVAPDPESTGVELALRARDRTLGCAPQDVDYINAHGTSTPQGDAAESAGDRDAFFGADDASARRELHQVDARPRARRSRRNRRRRDGAGRARRRDAADDQLRTSRSGVYARLRAQRRAQSADRRRAVQFVWFRRTQQRFRLRQSAVGAVAGEQRRRRMRALLKKAHVAPADLDLFDQAFVHESAAREQRRFSNERLEFLGDSVLGFVAASWLYVQHPNVDEGWLTRRKAAIVNDRALATTALRLGFPELLQMGEGMARAGGAHNETMLADAFEAFAGALFLQLRRNRRRAAFWSSSISN